MHNKDLKNEILLFLESFEENIGKNLNFSTALSSVKDNFNRHFTTFSSSKFILTNFTARISGARIMFMGENLEYEISIDAIIKFEENDSEILFLEAYSEKVFRRTIITMF